MVREYGLDFEIKVNQTDRTYHIAWRAVPKTPRVFARINCTVLDFCLTLGMVRNTICNHLGMYWSDERLLPRSVYG